MNQAVVEAEDRDDLVVLVEGRAQRGMIVDAQIAPKPDERGQPVASFALGSRTGSGRAFSLPSPTPRAIPKSACRQVA